MQYLWQYYLLIVLIIFQGVLLLDGNRQGKRIFFFVCFLELFFIAGFRGLHIGTDTPNYVNAFVLSINYPELMKSHMETGYLLFNRLLGLFSSNPQILLIVTSLFFVGVWLRTLYKYSISFFLSVLLFVILDFSPVLSMIRQEISICIVLLALPFVIKRQLLPFLAACCLASCFHTSAIVAIPLYFIYSLPVKLEYFCSMIFFCIILFIFMAPAMNGVVPLLNRYESYAMDRLLLGSIKLASVLKISVQAIITAFCFVSYGLYSKKANAIKSQISVSFLLWCSIVTLGGQFISIKVIGLDRLFLYFSSFNLISMPLFVHCYPRTIKPIVTLGLILCFVVFKSVVFVYRPEWNQIFPFEFCF